MSVISDYILAYVSSFALSFVWARYYTKNNLISLFIAVGFSASAVFLYRNAVKKKALSRSLSAKENRELEALAFFLATEPDSARVVANLLEKSGLSVTFMKNFLLALSESRKILAVLDFSPSLPSPQSLRSSSLPPKNPTFALVYQGFSIARRYNANEVVLFSSADCSALNVTPPNGVSFSVVPLARLKSLLDKAGISLPLSSSPPVKTRPNLLSALFSPKRAKAFALNSIFLVFMGFLSSCPALYYSAATLSIAFSFFLLTKKEGACFPYFLLRRK